MYRPAAEAMEQLQPGAIALVNAYFKSSIWARYTQPDEAATEQQDSEQALLAAAAPGQAPEVSQGGEVAAPPLAAPRSGSEDAAQHATAGHAVLDIPGSSPPTAAAAVAGSSQSAGKPALQHVSSTASWETLVDRPCSEAAVGPRSWLSRAGLGRPQLRPGLHLALGVAVSGTLVVVFKVFESLDFKSAWIVMTGTVSMLPVCGGSARISGGMGDGGVWEMGVTPGLCGISLQVGCSCWH